MARLVQEKIKNPFVDEVLFGRLKEGGSARIEVVANELVIKVEEEKERQKAKGEIRNSKDIMIPHRRERKFAFPTPTCSRYLLSLLSLCRH